MIGRTLSHFQITAKLGEGGMGEVYRATDTRLGREVAIKVLPSEFTEDREWAARFDREAKLLASLNHANIATIHEVGEQDGSHFLVMELVEGKTLAEKIARRPLALREALPLGIQIASGLEAAHHKGVIHRDLKPANVKITPGGDAKVLDFGLAKPSEEPADESPAHSRADTVTQVSEVGALLGTPGYMSPEQVRGWKVDTRSDIWSFGCLLYETLTGAAAFGGQTTSDRVAAVLEGKPELEALPAETPPTVTRLLERCLRKDRARRLHSIADVRIELEDALREIQEGSDRVEEVKTAELSSPVERTFRLTAEICRQLDRVALDPRVIGDDVRYLDNDRSSEVLVIYLPGMGLDHRIFEETLTRSRFRGLASNFYGCEPAPEHRIVMAMPDQLTVLRHLVSDAIERLAPEIVVLAGFSLGADAAFRLLAETDLEPDLVDGILSLGCNVSLETCFFSSRLAKVTGAEPEDMLAALREIGDSVTTLEDWVEVHRFLAELTWKYRSEMGVLQSLARGTLAPFEDPARQPFAEWYRYATEHDTAVRCVFIDSELGPLRRIQLAHVDEGILGSRFDDEDFFTESGRNHFELLGPEIIEPHLDWLVRRIRDKRAS